MFFYIFWWCIMDLHTYGMCMWNDTWIWTSADVYVGAFIIIIQSEDVFHVVLTFSFNSWDTVEEWDDISRGLWIEIEKRDLCSVVKVWHGSFVPSRCEGSFAISQGLWWRERAPGHRATWSLQWFEERGSILDTPKASKAWLVLCRYIRMKLTWKVGMPYMKRIRWFRCFIIQCQK